MDKFASLHSDIFRGRRKELCLLDVTDVHF